MSKPWEIKWDSPHSSDKEGQPIPLPGSEKDPLVKKRASLYYDLGGFRSWFRELERTFGPRLLVLLFAVHHCLKGFAKEFGAKGVPYMFKAYGVPAPQAQVFQGVAGLPWAMKPIIGLTSDAFPIFGYNKAPYMALTCVLGVFAYASLGCVPENMMPVGAAVMCLFLQHLHCSTCDLLAEAKYSEKVTQNPSHGPSILTYVWFGMQCASLLAIVSSGVALKYLGFRWMFIMCSIPAAFVLLPVLAGYIEEQCLTEEMKAEIRRRIFKEKEMCFLCLVMLVGTVTLSITGIMFNNYLVNAVLAITVAAVVLACFSVLLSPTIARFNAFSLIQTSCSLSTGGAAFYFFTDTVEEYPEGPHFSMFFYNSVLGTVGCICSLVGIWTYKKYLSTWRYRSLFIFTNVALVCINCADVVIFTRVNRRLGIPDKAFVLSAGVLENIIEMWMWMPQVVILSYMVPPGMEATMYALLAGCHNLGLTVSANCGALLLDQLNVRPKGAIGEGDMFNKLWLASLIATVLPLLSISSLFWLIPNVSQTEKFTDANTDSATSGSLWRRWRRDEEEVSY